MKLSRSLVIAATALGLIALGAGLEHLRNHTREIPVEPEVVPDLPTLPQSTAADPATTGSLRALRHRISELERQLAQRPDADLASQAIEIEIPENRSRRDSSSRRSGRDSYTQRMERMREENPEAYAEMQQRRTEMRQHVEQDFRNRADFLTSLDTRNMTNEQRENHEQLLATLARFDELREISEHGTEEMEREDRNALRQEMWENAMALGELYEVERNTLFQQAAVAAGYQGQEAEAFVNFLEQSIQSTTMSPFGMMQRGGMRGGGGFNPGGGGFGSGGWGGGGARGSNQRGGRGQ